MLLSSCVCPLLFNSGILSTYEFNRGWVAQIAYWLNFDVDREQRLLLVDIRREDFFKL